MTDKRQKPRGAFFRGRGCASGAALLAAFCCLCVPGRSAGAAQKDDGEQTVTLRVCSWEEYIDEGGWDEDEVISLGERDVFGEKPLVKEFEEWYYETYGVRVNVEYSTFGTNEELYSQMNLGNVYDMVCPSDYMIMKLMKEEKLEPLSGEFFDASQEQNYYAKGVSPYIRDVFEENEIDGKPWADYAAGYMWGITGIVYNPEEVSEEEASTWSILTNERFYRQVTVKDNVRDAYFPTLAILNGELLTDDAFRNRADYREQLAAVMNDTAPETILAAEEKLREIRGNVYSFETDSGKADMVTGKVLANTQWSGDAVYTMDQAEEDDFYLCWAVPEECTNLWFDGWVLLKDGIGDDAAKKHAAEAFINFLSMPENAVRNMYYIGYTSTIGGGEDGLVFDYLNWCYGAEEDESGTVAYPVGYFFSGDNEDEAYVVTTSAEQAGRQLAAQYPSWEEIGRSAVMNYFDDAGNAAINQMWINIRCFRLDMLSGAQWAAAAAGGVLLGVLALRFALKKRGYLQWTRAHTP